MLHRILSILLVLSIPVFSQYYSTVDPEQSGFISDLQTVIRNGYTKVSYDNFDETNVTNYASQDNGDGTWHVICVYTGYQYNYTPPFTWIPFSREHTWCHSWMPSYNSSSTNEYADQHHLFPTHQNNANGRRSNHPLGIVANITYQYLDGKLGTNSEGETVYEPRDIHKGDAARAMFYMSVRYDGLNGYDWSFDYLNNTTLQNLASPEAAQDVDLLIQWHKADPPDSWEIGRNDYIYSIQNNRNPFIDHPEYVNYIDFGDLTKLSPSYSTEPDNYITNLDGSVETTSITLTWTDAAAGSQAPSGYLVQVFSDDDYFIPIDGETYSDDTDLSDGKGMVNVTYAGADSYTFSSLDEETTYYFSVFSYNGSTTSRNYKIDDTIPQDNFTTGEGGSGSGSLTELIISEYVEGSSNNKAIEIFNGTGSAVNLGDNSYILEFYFNGNSSAGSTVNLSGTIADGDVFVVADNDASAGILAVTDQTHSGTFFNGDDAVVLKKGAEIIDVIGQVGFDPGSEWGSGLTSTQNNTLRRKGNVTEGDSNPDDAFDPATEWDGYAEDNIEGLGNPDPLPVELTSFTAETFRQYVILKWSTATEINNYGFEVERRFPDEEWNPIAFVEGHGNSFSVKNYSYSDRICTGQYLQYRLKQVDNDGSYEYSKVIEIEPGNIPCGFEMLNNYPNPFNPSTNIEFSLPVDSRVSVKVFDILGREIEELFKGISGPEKLRINWNAANLPSGVYMIKLEAYSIDGNEHFSALKKALLLK